MYASERCELLVCKDYMHNVNFLLYMKLLSLFVYSNNDLRVSLRFLQSCCLPAQAVSSICSSYVDHTIPKHFKTTELKS